MKFFPLRAEPLELIEREAHPNKRRSLLLGAAIAVILFVGMFVAVRMNALAPTFNGKVDVAALQKDPTAYTLDEADGAAYAIVAQNLDKTQADNICFSVVFNFRGYDTMGESFILIAALSGSLCILREPARRRKREAQRSKKHKEETDGTQGN